jgi:hypothetical protein
MYAPPSALDDDGLPVDVETTMARALCCGTTRLCGGERSGGVCIAEEQYGLWAERMAQGLRTQMRRCRRAGIEAPPAPEDGAPADAAPIPLAPDHDLRVGPNAVRLRARFACGDALVEDMRRNRARHGPALLPAGTYRRVYAHQLATPGLGIAEIRQLIAGLPLLVLAADPPPPLPDADIIDGPAPQPASRGYLAAHHNIPEET